jgi:hypothetical protein
MPIKEIRRKHGFSDASFYNWRSEYAGMDASEAKRLRKLARERQTQAFAGRDSLKIQKIVLWGYY